MKMVQDKKYNQFEKSKVRHISISKAVDMLTTKRYESTCVKRDYVRNIYDYYTITTDDSNNNSEAKEIDIHYIKEWEKLHDSCVGLKRAEELVVCYLCGPEPNNDFEEFVTKGVLPQNIWAFELDRKVYSEALGTLENGVYPQPRIISQNIETFMKDTPKQFDIIYIDACGSIPSSRHALRCIMSICKYQRLVSPGIIISNFTEPDEKDIPEYLDLVTLYLYSKENPITDKGFLKEQKYVSYKNDVKEKFGEYYGDFISSVLRDIPAIVVPLQRLSKNSYIDKLFKINDVEDSDFQDLKKSKKHAFSNFIMLVENLKSSNINIKKINELYNEFGGIEDIIKGIKRLLKIGDCKEIENRNLSLLKELFEKNKVYQFLDKPHFNMIYDVIINQLTIPYHNVVEKNIRLFYKAKTKKMYTDITVYDECRYIYEWLPAADQIFGAFCNKSWQYIFRFGMDGLIKQRSKYNNEFLYQGSVISKEIEGFLQKSMKDRERIEG